MLVIRNARVFQSEASAVACEGDRIVYVGDDPPPGETLDAQGRLLTAGLIDPHTHALFAGDRSHEFAQRIAGATYLEIAAAGGGIRSTVRATRAASDEELVASASIRLRRMLESGVTTVEVKTGYGLSVSEELRMLRLALEAGRVSGVEVIPTLLALHAIPEEMAREQWIDAVLGELLPEAVKQGARGIDAFCERGAFTVDECARVLQRGIEAGLTAHLHADQLSDGGGAALAASLGCASADHLEKASLDGIAAMARAGTVATLLPLAAWFLRDTPARAGDFLRAGATVALASNLNPGSQRIESVSMLLTAGCLFCGLTPAQALEACTSGAAKALRLDDRGRIAVGLKADLVLWDASSADHLAYHSGVEHAQTVIKNGRVVSTRPRGAACS